MYGAKLFLSLILKISAMNLTYWMQLGDIGGTGPSSATTLSAAQNINLGTVTTANSQDIRWSGVNYLRQSASQDVGSQISTAGNLTLNAGQDLNAKAATGQGAGNGVSYTNTQVAGNTVNIESGGDTTLKGAVVKANQVTTDVGGNLTIQSLQDQNQYKESSKSAGGSIMVGAGVSGSVNLAKSST
jgi:filamentous hemagglutinin